MSKEQPTLFQTETDGHGGVNPKLLKQALASLEGARDILLPYGAIFRVICKYESSGEYQYFEEYKIHDSSGSSVMLPLMTPSGRIVFVKANYERKTKECGSRFFKIKIESVLTKDMQKTFLSTSDIEKITNHISMMLMQDLWESEDGSKILA